MGARTSHVSSRKSFVLRPPKPPNTTMDLWHATAVWACRGIGATPPELRDHSFVHAFCAATGQSASRASNRRICTKYDWERKLGTEASWRRQRRRLVRGMN